MEKITTNIRRKMSKPSKEEILDGRIVPLLFKLGWPIMISSLLQTTYNLIDSFWIGRLPGDEGVNSLGAMALSWPLVFVMISLGMGLGIAALAMVSQHTGAQNYEEANKDAGQLYFILIVLSIVLGIIGFIFTEPMLNIVSGGSELVYYGTQYLSVIFLGLPFMMLFFSFSFILRAWGDTVTPMILMAISISINVMLDPMLIFGWSIFPRLGIQGAAIATVTSRGIATVISLYLLFSGKVGIELKLSYLKPRLDKIRKFFKIGIPATAARVGDSFGFVILMALLTSLPNHDNVVAAYGVGSRIINITFVILGGLGMAISTIVGQSLGADKIERAERATKKGVTIMVILMAVISLFLFLARYQLIAIFVPGKENVIRIGANFLAVLAVGGPFFAIFNGISGTLNGSGHTKQQMVISLARLWALRLPLVYLFAFVLSWYSWGAWWGMVVSNIVSAGTALFIYKRGWWKEKIIEPTRSKIVKEDMEE
ncbi:MAG: MATE family efflux transporter [Thermoplasmatota archaeon]